jgi:hypothetical protein
VAEGVAAGQGAASVVTVADSALHLFCLFCFENVVAVR